MCTALPVSERGFYKWKRNKDKPKAWQKLLAEIHKILEEDAENRNYGVERMMIALEQHGIKRSFSTVKRAMARGNLLHEDRRSPDGFTKADRKAMRPKNIIRQDFTAEAPLRKMLTDITQIPCRDGKLYVSPLLDCYNGEIISLVMDTNMKKELCMKTITEAYRKFDIKSGAIIHSDSGSQYTSAEYKKTLGQLNAVQSMSGVGKCWDNSRMESWFATLKKEKIYQLDTTKLTVEEVKTIVWRYTFAYYNTKRVTTVNPGGLPPVAYREKTASVKSAA
ncbi:MAG: IS3 family transposase [Treponema sp.]|nr:IS3 family transposase [Treponema sp.]MBR4790323.1 IS3 family transposase [Treponema sp.]